MKRIYVIIAICSSLIYLLLLFFYYHIDKYLPETPADILWIIKVILYLLMFGFILKVVIDFKKKLFDSNSFIILAICSLTLLYSFFRPFKLSSEMLESKPLIIAYWGDEQDHAYIKLRKDKTFDINERGYYFEDNWHCGIYNERNDTFFLTYTQINGNEPRYLLGDTVYNNGKQIITIGKFKDTAWLVPFNIAPLEKDK